MTNYTWDFENRLNSVTTLPASGGTVSFAYDPFGRRIKKISSSASSIYAYDGNNLIEETNASGAVVARYSQGLNSDEPLAMLRSSSTSFYHADGLGSVTSMSNAAGALAQTYTFDSFGKQTNTTGSLVNPFQYTGRESDSETGLYYYRARYYDANLGRFISEDPIRLRGGINFYRYAQNRPTTIKDPRGLAPGDVSWCHCELAGPREPIGSLCLYHCQCEDGHADATVLMPMDGLLGLKKMCGAILSCPSEVFAVRLEIWGHLALYGAYAGRP
jgi:RHS repeat-associated protein